MNSAFLALFSHLSNLLPFASFAPPTDPSRSSHRPVSLLPPTRLGPSSTRPRINLDIIPKDTPNLPKGYPKDTTPILSKTSQKCHIYYIILKYYILFVLFLTFYEENTISEDLPFIFVFLIVFLCLSVFMFYNIFYRKNA